MPPSSLWRLSLATAAVILTLAAQLGLAARGGGFGRGSARGYSSRVSWQRGSRLSNG